MKKAIFIMILAAMLTGCANSSEGEKTETFSRTSTAVNLSPKTEERSETFTETTTVETSKITKEIPKETTSLITAKTPETTTKITTEVTQKTVSQTVTEPYYEPAQTEIVTENQTEWQTPQTQDIPQTTTAATTKPPETSAPKPQTEEAENTVEWSENMKVWRKLCSFSASGKTGNPLSETEQNVIRNEIYKYAQNFNGRTEIQVNFGMDSYNISYEKPLQLTPDNSMTNISNAHMDSYCDGDSKWLIDYASSDEEIYEIVADTRQNCLQIIDHGLYNRWEIYSQNGALKYASEITFGVGFDGTCVWFLTED